LRSERRGGGRRALRAALALVGLCVGLLPAAVRADELVVVLNEKNPASTVSLQQLRLIYGGYKRSWPDGTPIQLLLPAAGSAAMHAMVTRVFKRQSEEEVAQYYVDLVFQQKLTRPPAQLPIRESLARVRSQPGAIVVAEQSEVDDPRGLRLLPLEGL
jgi:hypothetical protein